MAEIYDIECSIRFHLLGEYRYLDTSRITAIFPAIQISVGKKRCSRRDVDGFLRYNPSVIGHFTTLTPSQLFGEVPVGRFVRGILVDIFNFLDLDLYDCSPDDVSYLFCVLIYKILRLG